MAFPFLISCHMDQVTLAHLFPSKSMFRSVISLFISTVNASSRSEHLLKLCTIFVYQIKYLLAQLILHIMLFYIGVNSKAFQVSSRFPAFQLMSRFLLKKFKSTFNRDIYLFVLLCLLLITFPDHIPENNIFGISHIFTLYQSQSSHPSGLGPL